MPYTPLENEPYVLVDSNTGEKIYPIEITFDNEENYIELENLRKVNDNYKNTKVMLSKSKLNMDVEVVDISTTSDGLKESYSHDPNEKTMGDRILEISEETGLSYEEVKAQIEEEHSEISGWQEQTASGTYVRCLVQGTTLEGNRKCKFNCAFWASSSPVFNNDGQELRLLIYLEGTSAAYLLWTKYGNLGDNLSGNKEWRSYSYTLPSGYTWLQAVGQTRDKAGDSRFLATTNRITHYQGTSTLTVLDSGPNWVSVRLTYRNTESEEFCYLNKDGGWTVRSYGATGSGGTTNDFTITLNYGQSYTCTYGQIPDGGNSSSPWQWGTKTITLATKPACRIKVDGTYRNGKAAWIKVDGSYRPAKGIWIKVDGTYRPAK